MTSLAAEPASFSSRGARVRGQPGPQDIPSGVFVSLCHMPTGQTSEHRLCDAVLRCCVSTYFAGNGGVPGIHLDHRAPSIFRFGAKNRYELSPTRVNYAPIQSSLGCCSIRQISSGILRVSDGLAAAQHIGDHEVLNHDNVIPLNQSPCSLVMKVATLICDFAMPSCQLLTPPTTIVRIGLRPAQPGLRPSNTSCRNSGPPRVIDLSTIRSRNEFCYAKIDADLSSGRGQRRAGHIIARQDKRPAPSFTPDLDRLDPPKHLAVGTHLYMADALQIHTRSVCVPPRAVTILRPHHAVESVSALNPWIAWRPASSQPPEEPLERPVQPPKRGLLTRERPHSDIRTLPANVAELSRLFAVADLGSTVPPGLPPLKQCRVVQLSMSLDTSRQCQVLACCRPYPEFVSSPHSSDHRHRKRESRSYACCDITRRTRRRTDSTMIASYNAPPTRRRGGKGSLARMGKPSQIATSFGRR